MRSTDLAARKNSQSSYFLIAPCPGFGDFHTTSSAPSAWRSVHCWRDPLLPQGRNVVAVEASWSCGAIKQHCDAGCAKADIDNRAGPVSQLWAPKSSKFAHLKASADNKSVCLPTDHSTNPNPQTKNLLAATRHKNQCPDYVGSRFAPRIHVDPKCSCSVRWRSEELKRFRPAFQRTYRRRRRIERSINTIFHAPERLKVGLSHSLQTSISIGE